MKTFLLYIAIATFTFTTQAQDETIILSQQEKVIVVSKSAKVIQIEEMNSTVKHNTSKIINSVARVHKNKNYKVIKALNFRTKKKSLMA